VREDWDNVLPARLCRLMIGTDLETAGVLTSRRRGESCDTPAQQILIY